jgi:putative transposase
MSGTFSNIVVHVVFSTKDRLPLITGSTGEMLYSYLGGVVKGVGGSIITVGGMPDHVHLLARVPTKLSVADAVRAVKANSSKWINERVSSMKFGWQRGYGAFSVSQSDLPRVIDYIRNQERHHRASSFEEEFELLLTRHRIDFDNTYLF